ncbi:hypothetical protein BDB01DRAFT_436307 [Pilobolus umbonatus]|nr:hypothetical protein BDB01DRAFT_436307 [Pilobolus umbonatus]
MSDGIYTRHATLNAGAIPASAEELSQRHLKLFQQYSRLKAQHAVLKKAVIQEQASNITLQGNVKEKEKELRKLQEQIDLLSFHNERLTKRIQAVQESEQKGSHFSILGGSARKELEKSAQALEEANLDLERKIEENEKLHEELTETQSEFTHNINSLLRQIQTFEAKIAEIQDENTALLSEVNQLQSKKEENTLHEEIDRLKEELKEKTRFLEERGNSNELTAEVESLRAIVLAKLGNIEKDELKSTSLNESLHGLPEEIAIKLNLSHETWSEELRQLYSQLDKTKAALDKLVAEKTAIEKELLEDKKMSEESLNELKKDMAVQKENQEQSIQEKEAKVNELMSHIQLLENQSREGADEVNRIKQLETNIEDMSKENKALKRETGEYK